MTRMTRAERVIYVCAWLSLGAMIGCAVLFYRTGSEWWAEAEAFAALPLLAWVFVATLLGSGRR